MASLLELSRQVSPPRSRHGSAILGRGIAGRYLEVIEDMRRRGFTWSAICEFLAEHAGYRSGPDSLRTCYAAYKRAVARRQAGS